MSSTDTPVVTCLPLKTRRFDHLRYRKTNETNNELAVKEQTSKQAVPNQLHVRFAALFAEDVIRRLRGKRGSVAVSVALCRAVCVPVYARGLSRRVPAWAEASRRHICAAGPKPAAKEAWWPGGTYTEHAAAAADH